MIKQLALTTFCGVCTLAAHADYMWYYGDSSVEILQEQTGQSSGGAGLQVDWRDATMRVFSPNAPDPYASGYISVQQNRTTPATFNHAVISFDNMFGENPGQIGESSAFTINQATLWLYTDPRPEGLTLSLSGLAAPNAGWTKDTATFNTIDGINPWSGGTFSESLYGNYGTCTTTATNEASWIGIDITLALKAYQDHLISGIALIAPSEPTPDIKGLFAVSDDSTYDPLRHPGVFVDLVAVPEPATGGFLLLGGLLCWIVRHSKPVVVAAALTCSGTARADQTAWIGAGNAAPAPGTDLEIATEWKDAQINPDVTLSAPCGVRDEIGILARRTIPPLESVVLFSFNGLFAPTAPEQLPRSVAIDQAALWIYITQTVGMQDVALCGMHPADRDWNTTYASASAKGDAPWSGGSLATSITREYGRFRAPTRPGWFTVPVDLSTALDDYRAGRIGGIALRSLSHADENRLCNFYFLSARTTDPARRPALHVRFHPQETAPAILDRWFELNPETGQLEAHLHAPDADNLHVPDASAQYAFGGHWSFALPFSTAPGTHQHPVLLSGLTADTTEQLTETASPEPVAIHTDGSTLHLAWQTSGEAWYQVLESERLTPPGWKRCSALQPVFGEGEPRSCTLTPESSRAYYRVLRHFFAWNTGGTGE